MKAEKETEGTSVFRIREHPLSLGLIVKIPYGQADDFESKIEALFGESIVFWKWSTKRLYISDTDPREGERK